jgi:8-oxo-(d)GTP phosphatase
MAEPPPRADIVAAGAVVWRPGRQVLLVHRPRYDDWSFPKGKLDPGEPTPVAAVREVAEETGLRVRLGSPLSSQRYPVAGGRTKDVHYWVARVVGDDDISGYLANDEIDEVAWVPTAKARHRLTYDYDRATLAQALAASAKTRTLVVLRHGGAEARKSWPHDDRGRPLVGAGHVQAEALVPLLAAYAVSRVATSSSTRCVQTVEPYAEAAGVPVERHDGLSEEDATAESVEAVVDGLLATRSAVLCTHRPVLPLVLDAIGLKRVKLDPAALLVVHHRRGEIVAVER